MRGSITRLTERTARYGALAFTSALALGHLSLLISHWHRLSGSQVILLLAATGLCAALAVMHRTLCSRPVLLLIFALAALTAHPPGDVDSAASMAVLPALALLTVLLATQVVRFRLVRVEQTPIPCAVPTHDFHLAFVSIPSLYSRPPPCRR